MRARARGSRGHERERAAVEGEACPGECHGLHIGEARRAFRRGWAGVLRMERQGIRNGAARVLLMYAAARWDGGYERGVLHCQTVLFVMDDKYLSMGESVSHCRTVSLDGTYLDKRASKSCAS